MTIPIRKHYARAIILMKTDVGFWHGWSLTFWKHFQIFIHRTLRNVQLDEIEEEGEKILKSINILEMS